MSSYISFSSVVFAFLLIAISVASSGFNNICKGSANSPSEFRCRKALSELLHSFCKGSFYSPGLLDNQVEMSDEFSPFIEKPRALAYLQERSGPVNPICECCQHQCNMNELGRYCLTHPTKRAYLNTLGQYQEFMDIHHPGHKIPPQSYKRQPIRQQWLAQQPMKKKTHESQQPMELTT